jgi:hypothetical protein
MSSEPLFSVVNLLLLEVLVSYFELINHEFKGEIYISILQRTTAFQRILKELMSILRVFFQRLKFKISS